MPPASPGLRGAGVGAGRYGGGDGDGAGDVVAQGEAAIDAGDLGADGAGGGQALYLDVGSGDAFHDGDAVDPAVGHGEVGRVAAAFQGEGHKAGEAAAVPVVDGDGDCRLGLSEVGIRGGQGGLLGVGRTQSDELDLDGEIGQVVIAAGGGFGGGEAVGEPGEGDAGVGQFFVGEQIDGAGGVGQAAADGNRPLARVEEGVLGGQGQKQLVDAAPANGGGGGGAADVPGLDAGVAVAAGDIDHHVEAGGAGVLEYHIEGVAAGDAGAALEYAAVGGRVGVDAALAGDDVGGVKGGGGQPLGQGRRGAPGQR